MTWQQTIDEEKDIAFEEGVRQGLEQGMAQGLEQGMAQGMAQGLEQGMAQGMDKAQRESAIRMKNDGVPPELIAKYTGLTIDTINSL